MQRIVYFFAKKVDHKIAVSKKVAQIFRVNKIKDIKVINNAVLVGEGKEVNKTERIIYVGKLSLGKGIPLLLDSIPPILKSLKRAKIVIIGDGQFMASLKKFIAKSPFKKRITISGHVSHRQALSAIKRSRVLLAPSAWPEPLSRSIIESLISKTPVVATNIGGNPELISKNFGELTGQNSTDFAAAVVKVYNSPNYIRALIKRNSQNKLRFTQMAVNEYGQIYKN